jgi:hypothetical protein
MAARNYTNTATEATLNGSITSADTTIVLTSFAGFPSAPFTVAIDRGTPSEEVVLVTSISSSTVIATRGYDGTTPKSHAAGASFIHVTVAKDFTEANTHVSATSGIHGVAGVLVGTTDVQTLSNKTLTAPTLASATSTGTHAHANGTFSGTLLVTGATTLGALSATSVTVTGNVSVAGTTTLAAVNATSASLTGNQTVGGALSVTGATTLTGALSGSTATLSGALTGTTASFSGLVTAATTPTLAGHLVNKAYADALGVFGAATPNTIVRRDGAGGIVASAVGGLPDTPAAGDHAGSKNYIDNRIAALPKIATGVIGLAIGAGATTFISSAAFGTTFATPPRVFLSGGSSANEFQWTFFVDSTTTTGFAVRARWVGSGGAPTTGTVNVSWLAIL